MGMGRVCWLALSLALGFGYGSGEGPFWPQTADEWDAFAVSETEDVTRYCKPKIYLIQSGEDIEKYLEELECIFWGGVAPHHIPTGIKVAKSPDVKHQPWLGNILNQGLHGHFMFQTVCQGKSLYLDQPSVNPGIKPSTALMTIEPMQFQLAPGEYNDRKPSLQFNYDNDFLLLCPLEVSDPEPFQSFTHAIFAPFIPLNAPGAGIYFDSARIVGRDPIDGSAILLEKFYTKDGPGYTSVGWLWFKTNEPAIANQIPVGYKVKARDSFSYTQKAGKYIFKAMVAGIPADFASLPWHVFKP